MAAGASDQELSLTEWVVLGVLAEAPSHGFAVAKELRGDADLGRVITVHRPLVYRAMDRLGDAGFIEAAKTEPGRGPTRVVHRCTRRGRARADRWLAQPVDHVRDLRIEFLVKLRLRQRRGLETRELVRAQRDALADTLDQLTSDTSDDVVDVWRRHNAWAARTFLDQLAAG